MFQLAILIGIYSYLIFLLGIAAFLRKDIVVLVTLVFFLILVKTYFKQFVIFPHRLKHIFEKKNIYPIFLVSLIVIQAIINFVGALGPELGFDALWYHLTIPKIYLQQNAIFYIGGHLYYSAMPQLTEMLYLVALALGSEIVVKVIHFLFGIAVLVALYKIARMFLSTKDSILVGLIFYSNLVVGWMSITAYIDLARTFFEVMALWSFLIFIKYKKLGQLILSAIILGFAVSTKLLSLWSMLIYVLLIFYLYFKKEIKARLAFKQVILFCAVVLVIVSPWIIFSYLNTGYPFYPLFSPLQQNLGGTLPLSIKNIFVVPFSVFMLSPDPISPIYFISLPLVVFYFLGFLFKTDDKSRRIISLLILYFFVGLFSLYFVPVASSGRFIMSYLPAFSLVFILFINSLKNKLLYKFLLVVILIISFTSIAYRGIANKRFIPVILRKEDMSVFMSNNLEYQVGNFYDVDNFFIKNIKSFNKILIYGISNLYYVNFPYIHESWIKKGDEFDYILTKDTPLPERFKNWQLVYTNDKTRVRLYSFGGQKVEY